MCITGFVTDLLPKVPDIHKVKCCNTLAFNGCALFLLAASFAGIENHTIAVALVVAAFCVLGINAGGFFKSVVLVSRQYSPIVMTGVQVTRSLSVQLYVCVNLDLSLPDTLHRLVRRSGTHYSRDVRRVQARLLDLCGRSRNFQCHFRPLCKGGTRRMDSQRAREGMNKIDCVITTDFTSSELALT